MLRRLALPILAIMCSCAGSARREKSELRELSLHAYDEGLRFAEKGNFSVALDRFNRSASISPRPAAYYQIGRMKEEMGGREEAAMAYLTALEMAPDYQEARLALLLLGYKVPNQEEIAGDPEALHRFADQLLAEIDTRRMTAGEEAEARRLGDQRDRILDMRDRAARERLPTLGEVRSVIFTAEGELEDLPSATDPTYTDDVSVILNTYPYHFERGRQYQKQRQYDRAEREYELALHADPNQLDAILNLGDVLMRLERYPSAMYHYTAAREQFPDSARPLLKLGNYYDSLKKEDQARNYYRRALEMDPAYVEAYNNLAAIDIRNGDYAGAIDQLNRAIAVDPDYALGYLNLGIAQQNSGGDDAALGYYRKYVELGGEMAPEVRKWIAELEAQ